MATTAAWTTFRRVLNDPTGMEQRTRYANQAGLYRYRWHLYQNDVFDDRTLWYSYRQRYGLYRFIRPVYNPVRRLVDFYAGIVYPGVLSTDAKKLPDGTPLAIPLADDTPDALKAALGQLWQWSNWQTGKSLMVRYGASLGDVLVEIVDEVDRGKVTFDIVWPGLVSELELDGTGNVKRYVIEYDAKDENDKTYTYKKEVDSEWIVEYKDDEPFQYDEGIDAARPNPYGFAPAVWCKHTDVGGNHGEPAVRNVGKIDELNEIASHAHDQAHRVMESPLLISGEGVAALTDTMTESKRVATQDLSNASGARESVKIFKSNGPGSMSTVQLPEGQALNFMNKLLEEIEADHPELNMYADLRAMSQVTGPAAERLIGDAASYIQEARANYDQQSVKLFQMSIAIAGWRANSGAWGTLNRQQQAFSSFSLESYEAGLLDFEIMPRPIVPDVKLTPDEQRALMERGDRGYMPRSKVVTALGGDEADVAAIDAEQAANTTRDAADLATVDAVVQRVRGQNGNAVNGQQAQAEPEGLPNA